MCWGEKGVGCFHTQGLRLRSSSLVKYYIIPPLRKKSSVIILIEETIENFQAADINIFCMNRPSIFRPDNSCYNGCNQGCRWSTSAGLLLALFS